MILGHTDRDHVLLNVFAEMNACIEASRHDVQAAVVSGDVEDLFYAHVHLHGGPAPVRRFLPELIDLVWKGKINPGKVFDLVLPLDQVAESYRAMDERRAIKALLTP